MSEPIFNTVTGIFGKRGTGKTEYLKGNEKFKLPGFFPTYLKKDMKILIIDTIDHPSYSDVPVINQSKLAEWKRGVYRIWVPKHEMPALCRLISETIWNALLVFEDAAKHQRKVLSDAMIGLIGDSKQQNIDIIYMYHNWKMAPKELYGYLDLIDVFKTKGHPREREEDMEDYYEEALQVYEEVKAHPSRFYHKLLDTEI